MIFAAISQGEAYKIAANWFEEAGFNTCNSRIKKSPSNSNSNKNESYYIFNHKEGAYIIVSGIDDENPIIGYSTECQWDHNNVPPFLKEMLDNYNGKSHVSPKRANKYIRQNNAKLLTTANWGQHYPYNAMLERNYPIGCVATAIAIALRYYESPLPGKGTHSYESSYDGKTYSFDFNRTFDWSKMPLKAPYNDEEANSIAELTYAAAVASDMTFAPGGSGAMARPYSIQEFFNYSQEIIQHRSEFFSLEEIEDILYEEIDNNRVVIVSGGSHCFICDGYANDYFHFNFGWDGQGNGNFHLSSITPVPAEFPYIHIITGIQPAEGINDRGIPWRIARGSKNAKGIMVNSDKIEKGGKYNFAINDFQAQMEYPYPFEGELALALCNEEGIKEILYSEPLNFNCFYGEQRFVLSDVEINCDLDVDDYICAVGRAIDVSKWSIIPVEKGLRASIKVGETGIKGIPVIWDFGFNTYEYYDYDSNNLTFPGSRYAAHITIPQSHTLIGCLVNGFPYRIDRIFEDSEGCRFNFIAEEGVESYTVRPVSYTEHDALNNCEATSSQGGTLSLNINHDDYIRLVGLKVNGEINEQDFELLQCLPYLKTLDLRDATITGNNPRKVPDYAFEYNSNIEKIIIPKSTEEIGNLAFVWSSLKSLHFGPAIKTIGSEALRCEELEEFYVEMQRPIEVLPNAFESMNLDKVILYVPVGTKNLYKNSPYAWRDFKNIVEFDYSASIEEVESDNKLSYETNHRNLTISSNVPVNVNVIDLNGRVVISDKVSGIKNYSLEPGIYILSSANGKPQKVIIP